MHLIDMLLMSTHVICFYEETTQRAHDVNITSPQCRCNVMTLHRRWGDVVFTSCACRAETYWSFLDEKILSTRNIQYIVTLTKYPKKKIASHAETCMLTNLSNSDLNLYLFWRDMLYDVIITRHQMTSLKDHGRIYITESAQLHKKWSSMKIECHRTCWSPMGSMWDKCFFI